MKNAFGVEIIKGCCSCANNAGPADKGITLAEGSLTVKCNAYGMNCERAGKQNCEMYQMKGWLWDFSPTNTRHGQGEVKPAKFFQWLRSIDADTLERLLSARNPMKPTTFIYHSPWQYWYKTAPEGMVFIMNHPEMRTNEW